MQLDLRVSRSGAMDAEAKEGLQLLELCLQLKQSTELKSGAELRAGLASLQGMGSRIWGLPPLQAMPSAHR